MLPPAFGTWPQNDRGIFRGPAFEIWDVSVTKNMKIKERVTAAFRVEVFNVLNHPTFSNPQVNPTQTIITQNPPNQFASSQTTLDAGGQNPVVGSGGPRSMQLGLKLTF
jgi:hypothetical protein